MTDLAKISPIRSRPIVRADVSYSLGAEVVLRNINRYSASRIEYKMVAARCRLLTVVGTKVSSPPAANFRHFISKNQNTITVTAMTNSAKTASSVGLG
jgi:hypothetical protein